MGEGALLLIIFLLFVLADLSALLVLRRNILLRYQKASKGRTITGKVVGWKEIPGLGWSMYIIRAEYLMGEEIRTKLFLTNGSWAKQYVHKKEIELTVLPGSKKVYLKEEKWTVMNIWLFVLMFILTFPFMLPLLGICAAFFGKIGLVMVLLLNFLFLLLLYIKMDMVYRKSDREKRDWRRTRLWYFPLLFFSGILGISLLSLFIYGVID